MIQMIAPLLFATLGFYMTQRVPSQPQDHEEPLSVCELLKNRQQLNGKDVSVRGLFTGTDEGVWLTSNCTEALVTAGYRWPTSIWIAFASSDYRSQEDFERVRKALKRLDGELRRLHFKKRRDRFWVTCIGVFGTDPRLGEQVNRGSDQELRGYGFGHLNAAPGVLLLRDIKDVKIERGSPVGGAPQR